MHTVQQIPQRALDALEIASNPKPEYSTWLRSMAWATLKAERGQIVRQLRMKADCGTARRTQVLRSPAHPNLAVVL